MLRVSWIVVNSKSAASGVCSFSHLVNREHTVSLDTSMFSLLGQESRQIVPVLAKAPELFGQNALCQLVGSSQVTYVHSQQASGKFLNDLKILVAGTVNCIWFTSSSAHIPLPPSNDSNPVRPSQ